jgi:hypothetical protein
MREIEVFNCARAFLAREGFRVIQLVPPGGQTPLSVSFSVEEKRKTVFPDLLAIRNGCLWVGELKPRFDCRDYKKLILLRANGERQLREICVRATRDDHKICQVNYVLCHSEGSSPACPLVFQWIFETGSANPTTRLPVD